MLGSPQQRLGAEFSCTRKDSVTTCKGVSPLGPPAVSILPAAGSDDEWEGWVLLLLTHCFIGSVGTVHTLAECERFHIIFLLHFPQSSRQEGVNYGKSVPSYSSLEVFKKRVGEALSAMV